MKHACLARAVWLAVTSSTVLLSACGGGGGDGPTGAAAQTSGTSSGAGLVDTLATATDIAVQAQSAIGAAQIKALAPGVGQVSNLALLPTGLATTTACSAGGTISTTLPTHFSAGTTYRVDYSQCSFGGGTVFNGSFAVSYTNFTSTSAFSWTIRYDLNYTGPNVNYSYSGTQTCSFSGSYACTYNDGTRDFGSGFSDDAGTISGSYDWTYGHYGTLHFTFVNWSDTGGSIAITGPDNFKATVVRTGANNYTVTINGGNGRTITVST